jgi:hypothetical protein
MLGAGGFRPDLILVDYGSVLKPERRIGKLNEELGGIYEDLNGLAGEYNAVLWSGVQVPQRSYVKPVLELGDIAGSAEIGEHTAILLTFNQTLQEEIDNRFRFYGAKVRRKQDHGIIVGHVDRDRCKMTTEAWLNSAGTLVAGTSEGETAEALEEVSGRQAMTAKILPRRAPRVITQVPTNRNGRFQRPEVRVYPLSPQRLRPEPTVYSL